MKIKYFIIACCMGLGITPMAKAGIPVFPGAEGFGAVSTTGGRGGRVVYVTNLACQGKGSLNDALARPGKKYILFKVSGIIDCAAEILWGDAYIAGQTSPGGVIVRGIIADDWYEREGKAQNVIIRHLNSRPNTEANRPGKGWVLDDGLRLDGAKNIVVDHCSLANATDETIQISRSSGITIQNSLLSEVVGGHYMYGGMLMNYSVTNFPQDAISIHHNLWNRIGGRMPEISCEQSGEAPNDQDCLSRTLQLELSNNVLWDIPIQVWYDPTFSQDTREYKLKANIVGNYAVARNTYNGPFFNHRLVDFGVNKLYVKDNRMNRYPAYRDYQLFYCCNDFNLYGPNTDLGIAQKLTARNPYPAITYTASTSLRQYMVDNVGAFNGFSQNHRDPMNRRLLQALANNKLDTKPVNGTDYFRDAFKLDFTKAPSPPVDSDNDGMPDAWEVAHGLAPLVADHNGTQLSVEMTGMAGYTNLECYLNELAEKLPPAKPSV